MKYTLILCTILLFKFALIGQELSSATLHTRLIGYWKGDKLTNDQEVLVINADKSYQFYKNKVKTDFGTLEIDYHYLFRLNFHSHFGEFTPMDYPKGYIWTLPEDKLQFGSSPIDGGDAFFDRMNSKEIDEFWGKKLLSKAIKEQSEQLLIQYFLDNFSPAFSGNKNITYLVLRADRAKVLQACLTKKDKKYRNWLFLEKYLCSEMNGQHDYDFTDTPMIQNLVFNTQLNLAMVEYVSSYAWVKDVYEKKDGKWQFYATLKNKK